MRPRQRLMVEDQDPPPAGAGPSHSYEMTPIGVVHLRETPSGVIRQQLSNFPVTITRQVIISDGVDERRELVLCAVVDGREIECTIPARGFAALNWIIELLGAGAIVFPGCRDHFRAGIQMLSEPVPTQRIFGH